MARSPFPAHRDPGRPTGSPPEQPPSTTRERRARSPRISRAKPAASSAREDRTIAFSTGRILALLGDPVERLLVDERLSASGEFDVQVVPQLKHAVASASRHFDAIVLDLKCVATEPPEEIRRLVDVIGETPLIVLGESEDRASADEALAAGAEDFVPRALLGSDALLHAVRRGVARDTRRLELDRLAFTDPLTGLLNRRGFKVIGGRALDAAERLGSTFTILFFDVDSLEQINAAYGHSMGDAALCETARMLGESVRAMDIVARVGEDEFCVALTDGSPPATTVAQRLGRAFDEANESRNAYLLSLTLGVTDSDEWRHPTLDQLLSEAASRMLTAKITEPAARPA